MTPELKFQSRIWGGGGEGVENGVEVVLEKKYPTPSAPRTHLAVVAGRGQRVDPTQDGADDVFFVRVFLNIWERDSRG